MLVIHYSLVIPMLASDSQATPTNIETVIPLEPEWLSLWPAEWKQQALEIATCESHLNPRATHGSNILGLFQLWEGWFTSEELPLWYDPVVNSKVALRVRLRRGRWGGSGGWECADILGIY